MSLLDGRKAYYPLKENTPYTVTILGFTETALTEEAIRNSVNQNIIGYLSFKLKVDEDGREISHNCTVPTGTDIFARQILQQLQSALGNQDFNGIDQLELFQRMMNDSVPLTMWMTKNDRDGVSYTNYSFQPPLVKAPVTNNTTASDADDKPFD